MPNRPTTRRAIFTALCIMGLLSGCSQQKPSPNTATASPFSQPMSLAVAPILNFSGEFTLDPLKAADLLASELCSVNGVTVLPVSRVAAYLATQGKRQIESPAHAVAVAQAISADAILVAGITEYDAYTPAVGLVLQMYTVPGISLAKRPNLDPVAMERRSCPVTLVETADSADPTAPTSQVQAVFNANHEWVVKALREYAEHRSEEFSPYGWRQYLKVQTLYLRFCWHEAIERLLRQEKERRTVLAEDRLTE